MKRLRVLHLEDNAADAFLVRSALEASGIAADILPASRQADFLSERLHQRNILLHDSART